MTTLARMIVAAALIMAPMVAKAADNAAQSVTEAASDKHPNCKPEKSKPCGRSCIALYKVCHKD
jgi:hypothetical protein